MRVLLMTLGTRGDVQPFVTLARGLMNAGYEATVASSGPFRGLAEEHNVPFEPLELDFTALQDSAAGKAAMSGRGKGMIEAFRQVKPLFRTSLSDQARVVAAVEPDVLLTHPKTLGGPHLAEWRGIAQADALVVPGFTPTTAFPPIPLTWTRTPGWLNRAAYRMVPAGMASFRGIVREWRRDELGLDPSAPLWNGGLRTLYGYSRFVVPNPPDWPLSARAVGYWLPGPPQGYRPDRALQEFLDAGDPPVYLGFGSMRDDDPHALGDLVTSAVEQAGVRAVVQSGQGLLAAEASSRVHVVDRVPHGWLFPRMSCVVHHGGSGTTGEAIMSSNPQVVVPFSVDQPFWAKRMHHLGVAPEPLPRKALRADRLAAAIKAALTDPAFRRAAIDLGERVAREDGIAGAIAYLEALRRSRRDAA